MPRTIGSAVRRLFAPLEWAPAFLVTSVALVAIVLVVLIAVVSIPSDSPGSAAQRGPSIVAIAAAAFGVIGATVGAFFSVKSATDALKRRGRTAKRDDSRPSEETEGPEPHPGP